MAENYSPDLFSVDEVHKIAILDIRLLQIDRNAANILVRIKRVEKKPKSKKKSKFYHLIPIDHSMCIPDHLEVNSWDLCWADWDQVDEPFS